VASTVVKHYRVYRNGKLEDEVVSGEFKTMADARNWYIERTKNAAKTLGLTETDVLPLLDFQLIETSGNWQR